jgi:hypothetical protein
MHHALQILPFSTLHNLDQIKRPSIRNDHKQL